MAPYTGLQVAHEPGEGLVWTGCVLMALGLVLAFWGLHRRYWAIPLRDDQGRLSLWVGAASHKRRETFDREFDELAGEIEEEMKRYGKGKPRAD